MLGLLFLLFFSTDIATRAAVNSAFEQALRTHGKIHLEIAHTLLTAAEFWLIAPLTVSFPALIGLYNNAQYIQNNAAERSILHTTAAM